MNALTAHIWPVLRDVRSASCSVLMSLNKKRQSDCYHMISAHENKCAMCGKYVLVSDGIDKENETSIVTLS